MLKQVVFVGLAATAVATVCAASHAAHYRHDKIKIKSRKNGVVLHNNQTVNKPVKVPVRRCPIGAMIDANAWQNAHLYGRHA